MHLTISCDTCVARHTAACDDCVVTFFCGPEPDLELSDAEAEAVAGLSAAGLVPNLRYRPGGPAAHPSAAGRQPGAGAGRHPALRLVRTDQPEATHPAADPSPRAVSGHR